MTVEQFENEKLYNDLLHIVMEMVSSKVISEDDAKLTKAHLIKKYNPLIFNINSFISMDLIPQCPHCFAEDNI